MISPAQTRVLQVLHKWYGWHILETFHTLSLLEDGDCDEIPALIERGLIEKKGDDECAFIRILPSGRVLASEAEPALSEPSSGSTIRPQVTQEMIARIHLRTRDRLPMWVIYRPTTSDFQGKWIGRLHLTLPVSQPTEFVILGASLDDVRRFLPRGLAQLPRGEHDDPVIEEMWL